MTSFPVFSASVQSTARAFAEAASGRLSFWDANLLCSAEHAGCTHIISEDMADGLRIGRLEVVRAFDNGRPSERVRAILQL
jgi:predicted nucleic acid-binding protein